MPIRFAEPKDLRALVQLGARMHALTRFRSQTYNAQKVADSFVNLMRQGQHNYVFLVAESAKGEVVGGLIGLVEQQIFSDAWTASIMHYDVLPEYRMGGYGVRLLKAFEQWAKNRKVIEISFGINSEDDMARTGKFAGRMGYRKVGENYVREFR